MKTFWSDENKIKMTFLDLILSYIGMVWLINESAGFSLHTNCMNPEEYLCSAYLVCR